MKTNKNLTIKKGAYSALPGSAVFVPCGSPVERRETFNPTQGKRIEYFVRPSAIKDPLDRHDATYYGLRVNAEDVTE